ncbi:MAG: hypothetical protein ACJASR_000027 [Psychroserpens sp.]|jgi:hypothetical protein
MSLAPIVLFVFNRPEHTLKTLEALSNNYLANQSDLIVFCDGPKASISEKELNDIQEVRKIVKNQKWCKSLEIRESQLNRGLANSIIEGVTEIVNNYGKVIVLEDDLLTSPFFLRFMNDGLNKYEKSKNVYSINGYMYPIETNLAKSVLLPLTSTWGWATWRESWGALDLNMIGHEELISNPFLKQRFNIADYDYIHMLSYKNNSWGIKWYFSVFSHNGLGVFPTKSLISNIGFDGSGTNCESDSIQTQLSQKDIPIELGLTINLSFYSKYLNYFRVENKLNKNIIYRLKRYLVNKLFI